MGSDYKKYLNFINSEEYIELEKYYCKYSVFDILNVTRQENPHSGFIKWLLNPKSAHGLGDYPMKKFIETCIFSKEKIYASSRDAFTQRENIFNNKNDLLMKTLKYGNYEVVESEISNEVTFKDVKSKTVNRFDIFGLIKISTGDNIVINIENKVTSTENIKISGEKQTETYANYLFGEYKNKNCKNANTYFLPCFLSPLNKEEYTEVKTGKNICSSKEFLCLNYQYLLDGVIEPCYLKVPNGQAKRHLEDYIKCLGKPSYEFDNDKNKVAIGNLLIMATGKKEKLLINKLYSEHKDTIDWIANRVVNSIVGNNTNNEIEFNEKNQSFYYGLFYSLSNMYDNIIYSDCKNILCGANNYKYRFHGTEYIRNGKSGNSLGILCMRMIEDYLIKNLPNISFIDIRSKLKNHPIIGKSRYVRQIIISQDEYVKLPQLPPNGKINYTNADCKEIVDDCFVMSHINGGIYYIAKYFYSQDVEPLITLLSFGDIISRRL